MLAFTSVYFFESGLFNGLRPFGIKIFSLHFADLVPRAMPRTALVSPLRTWKSPDVHQRKYTEKSPIRQEFVGCNRPEASERFNLFSILEAEGVDVVATGMHGLWGVDLGDASRGREPKRPGNPLMAEMALGFCGFGSFGAGRQNG